MIWVAIWIREFLPFDEMKQDYGSQTLYFEANALEYIQTQRFPVCLHRRFGSIHRLTHTQSWTQGGYGEPGLLHQQQQLQQIGTLCLSLLCVPTFSHNVRELRQTQLTGIWIRSVKIFLLWLDYDGVYWLKRFRITGRCEQESFVSDHFDYFCFHF